MANKISKVDLVRIDTEGIKEDPRNRAFAFLPFQLSQPPDRKWIEIFEGEYDRGIYLKKRQLHEIASERIVLHIGLDDDPQGHYDFVKEVINATNKEVDRLNPLIAAREKEQEEEEKERKRRLDQLIKKAYEIKK